jgi:hypothetical protein
LTFVIAKSRVTRARGGRRADSRGAAFLKKALQKRSGTFEAAVVDYELADFVDDRIETEMIFDRQKVLQKVPRSEAEN